jgi:hypothetical protein
LVVLKCLCEKENNRKYHEPFLLTMLPSD